MVYRQSFFKTTRKPNKYRAKRSEYNGIIYDSMREAKYAEELDWRKKAKDITDWSRQKKIEFNLKKVKDEWILTDEEAIKLKEKGTRFIHITNYYLDFVAYLPDGEIQFIEVKGMELTPWKMKWKMLEALYGDHKTVTMHVVK